MTRVPLASFDDAGGDGVVWALNDSVDLNANLVVLGPGGAIGEHRNDEVDVLVVVIAGDGTATVDGDASAVVAHDLVHIRRGTRRRIDAGPHGLRYLTVHRRRGPLGVGRRSPDAPSG